MKTMLEEAFKKFDGMNVKVTTPWCSPSTFSKRKYDYQGPICYRIHNDMGKEILVVEDAVRKQFRFCWLFLDEISHVKETKNTLTLYCPKRNGYIKFEKTGAWRG